jgi:hypothetical protein
VIYRVFGNAAVLLRLRESVRGICCFSGDGNFSWDTSLLSPFFLIVLARASLFRNFNPIASHDSGAAGDAKKGRVYISLKFTI